MKSQGNMTFHRSPPKEKFTQMPNAIPENPKISWKAKGLMNYLLSRPEDWTTRREHLVNVSTDGLEALRSGMKELEEAGYLRRSYYTTEGNGKTAGPRLRYEVFQDPISPISENQSLRKPEPLETDPPTKTKKELSTKRRTKTEKTKNSVPAALLDDFDEARKFFRALGGRVRGLGSEHEVFIKACRKQKHHPATEVAKMVPAIEAEDAFLKAKRAAGEFAPEWKNFSTWLNQCCWLQELPPVKRVEQELPNWDDVV